VNDAAQQASSSDIPQWHTDIAETATQTTELNDEGTHMIIKKVAATALLTIAATAITCGTATAEPTREPWPASDLPTTFEGNDHGVGYNVHRDGATLVADIAGGAFHLGEHEVTVTGADGVVIASLPLQLPIGDHEVKFAPRVEGGTKLIATAQDIGYWRHTSPRQRSTEAGAGLGSALGGLVGAFLGIAVGVATMGLLIPITLPVGLILGLVGGGLIGGAAGNSIPNSDVPDQWKYELECWDGKYYRYCW
jgi:hypothetical protein